MEHHTLENLAMNAFGNYVSEILETLIDLIIDIFPENLDPARVDYICRHLEDLIHLNVLPSTANYLTEVTLKHISLTLERCVCWHHERTRLHQEEVATSYDFIAEYLEENHQIFQYICVELASKIACAMTHKSVSAFRYDHSVNYKLLKRYIERMLSVTNEFQVLVLKNIKFSRTLIIPPKHLEVCVSENISEELMNILENSSRTLRLLDLNSSNDSISDQYIDIVLKCQNLNILNVNYTVMSQKAKKRLLGFETAKANTNPLAKRQPLSNLKFLGLTLEPNEPYLLAKNFPNVIALQFSLDQGFDLKPLKELEHLESLSISSVVPHKVGSYVKDLICEVGPRLLSLKLNVGEVDLKCIAVNCKSLKKLYHIISSDDYPFFDHVSDNELLQYFPTRIATVEEFKLFMYGDRIWRAFPLYLSCLMNVKKLCVYTDANPEEGSISLNECLIRPLIEGRFKALIFNDNKIDVVKDHAVITSSNGYSITIPLDDLETILKQINQEKSIQDLGRKFVIVPREKLREIGIGFSYF